MIPNQLLKLFSVEDSNLASLVRLKCLFLYDVFLCKLYHMTIPTQLKMNRTQSHLFIEGLHDQISVHCKIIEKNKIKNL